MQQSPRSGGRGPGVEGESSLPKRMLHRAANLLTSTGAPAFKDLPLQSPERELLYPAHPHSSGLHRRLSDSGVSTSLKQFKNNVVSRTKSVTGKHGRHGRTQSEAIRPPITHFPSDPIPRMSSGAGASTSTSASNTSSFERPSMTVPNLPQSPVQEEDDGDASNAEIKVPALLQQGTPLLKVSAKNVKSRVFKLDADLGQILWESKKSGIITIENIKEIRSGSETQYYREQFKIAASFEERWLTIVYISDGKYKTLHLVAFTSDVFQMWNTTLRQLYELRQDLMSGLGNMERRQKVWEKHYWKGADQSGDQRLDFEEVEQMCRRLNIHSPRADLLNRFMEADSQSRGFLDFADFQKFVTLLKTRPEVTRLFNSLRGPLDAELNYTAFEKFMRGSQKSDLEPAELVRIFRRFLPHSPSKDLNAPIHPQGDAPTIEATPKEPQPEAPPPSVPHTEKPISETPIQLPTSPEAPVVSPPTSSPPSPTISTAAARSTRPPPKRTPSHQTTTPPPAPELPDPSLAWTLASFTSFLLSADNSPFSDHQNKIWHDMNRPLSEYFISSSHNTYLVGHQLVGDSTVEGYIRALLHGCRSVELDIWDGDREPMVYHGRTLTSSIPVTDVSRAIARYAFVASPYPIIISAEIHCCLEQQDMVANTFREIFGDMLVTAPIDGKDSIDQLPSPEMLKHRILLKAKNLYATQTGEVEAKTVTVDGESSETSSSDMDAIRDFKQEISKARSFVDRVRGKGSATTDRPGANPTSPRARTLALPNSPSWKGIRRSQSTSSDTSSSDMGPMDELKQEISKAKREVSKAKNLINKVRGKRPPSISHPSSDPPVIGGSSSSANTLSPASTFQQQQIAPRRPSQSAADRPKIKMSLALVALLVYTVGVKCRGFNKKEKYAIEHVFSLSERTANKILKESMVDLVKHNRTHVVRIYPNGTRLSSSNYEPHRYWAAGAQLVAINWQTFDIGYMINYSMFQRNGRSGYVLKPPALRLKDKESLGKRTKHFLDVTIISAQQLPRPKDEKGHEISTKYIFDPYVEVSVHVPDWSHSPFLPETPATYSGATNAGATSGSASSARTLSYKTGVVKNNGFNPVWEESMNIPFDCMGEMRDLIFVRFQVKDEHDDDDLAVYCVSLGSLQSGYRHLPLHDNQLSQYLFSTLFVQTSIRNID